MQLLQQWGNTEPTCTFLPKIILAFLLITKNPRKMFFFQNSTERTQQDWKASTTLICSFQL